MRYQVITWTWDEGHDERREFSTLAQARAAARIYRRECDGVGIYDSSPSIPTTKKRLNH